MSNRMQMSLKKRTIATKKLTLNRRTSCMKSLLLDYFSSARLRAEQTATNTLRETGEPALHRSVSQQSTAHFPLSFWSQTSSCKVRRCRISRQLPFWPRSRCIDCCRQNLSLVCCRLLSVYPLNTFLLLPSTWCHKLKTKKMMGVEALAGKLHEDKKRTLNIFCIRAVFNSQ